ncbi:MAG: hypothetical protein FWF01_04405 [Alphaproteobacteria bacterium]|nr:hypothetical protein [Alphaproteobacteria bacterium]
MFSFTDAITDTIGYARRWLRFKFNRSLRDRCYADYKSNPQNFYRRTLMEGNCYSHAMGWQLGNSGLDGDEYTVPAPGMRAGLPVYGKAKDNFADYLANLRVHVEADGGIYLGMKMPALRSGCGWHAIFAATSKKDYHFYTCDNGVWTHKDGSSTEGYSMISALDYSGNRITNPLYCDRGKYINPIGFFAVPDGGVPVGRIAAENAAIEDSRMTRERMRELRRLGKTDKEALVADKDFHAGIQYNYLRETGFFRCGCAMLNRRIYGLTRHGQNRRDPRLRHVMGAYERMLRRYRTSVKHLGFSEEKVRLGMLYYRANPSR